MNDALGDRMKNQYENRTRYYLPRRTYTIIRIDGESFHSFTRKYEKPFDLRLHSAFVQSCGDCIFRIIMCSYDYCQSLDMNENEDNFILNLETTLPNCPLKEGEISIKLEHENNN